MNLREYQDRAHETAVYPEDKIRLSPAQSYTLMALGGEAGELLNLTKKALRGDYGDTPTENLDFMEKLRGELGGILWYLAEVHTAFGLSFEITADYNLFVLADRAERGVIKGDGDDR